MYATVCMEWAGIAQSYSDALRAGRSGDRIQIEASSSAPVQYGCGAHPFFYTMGARSLTVVKRPERGFHHPLHLGLK
jgi:hypothetical protein